LSNLYPENILSKIARAYLSKEDERGRSSGFSSRVGELIKIISDQESYDVLLVDARAGLHETTAASVVGLSGDTFLFGVNQPQTYTGYRALFSQLSLTLGEEWKARIHLVEAKVGANGPSTEFVRGMLSAMPQDQQTFSVEGIPLDELRGVFDLDWDDSSPDRDILIPLDRETDSSFIYDNEMFRGFDPIKHPEHLNEGIYYATFENFIERCNEIIDAFEQKVD